MVEMRTDCQRQASRINGAKSKGPNTPEGKARAAQNSRRHGMLANTIILDGESDTRFTELLRALKADLDPEGEVETALVENMAVARWRQMRLWAIEKASLSHEMRKRADLEPDNPTRAALAFKTLSDESRSLELVNRYETRYDRQYSRALSRLLELRQSKNRFLPNEPGEKQPVEVACIP